MRRLLRWRRLRWFAIGAALRFVFRRSAARSIDRATADIEDRLPEPVRKALDLVPADAARAGGSAVVAAKTAKRVATGGRRASKVANDRRRQVADGIGRIRSLGDEVGREAERRRRDLKDQYLRATEGDAAADEALLDLRHQGPGAGSDRFGQPGGRSVADYQDELPTPKEPIRSGRWRAERRSSAAVVNRVKRSYRPDTRPWDR